VARILEQARGQIARSVNTAMVQSYWLIGREIVEVEQAGEERASYGDEVIQRLSTRLAATHGKGFSVRNLRNMRQFYLRFQVVRRRIQQTPSARSRATTSSKAPAAITSRGAKSPSQALVGKSSAAEFPQELSWSHYLVLTRVVKPTARAFYEIEAARECWSVRQLERQIRSSRRPTAAIFPRRRSWQPSWSASAQKPSRCSG
jgi:hypothetical protein